MQWDEFRRSDFLKTIDLTEAFTAQYHNKYDLTVPNLKYGDAVAYLQAIESKQKISSRQVASMCLVNAFLIMTEGRILSGM